MFGLNNAQLIGRLGADVTISRLTNGGRVGQRLDRHRREFPRQKLGGTRWTAPSGTASSPSRTAWWR